mmetsp:Transcript_3061/g.4695  ORF Transcript_3061/g.4695 Transcript_3061/m.4695 type:complete len:245 (-) Transcript_3061:327-1061(-)
MLGLWKMSLTTHTFDIKTQHTKGSYGRPWASARMGYKVVESNIGFKRASGYFICLPSNCVFPSRELDPVCTANIIIDHKPQDVWNIAFVSLSAHTTITRHRYALIKRTFHCRNQRRHCHIHLNEISCRIEVVSKEALLGWSALYAQHTHRKFLFISTSTIFNPLVNNCAQGTKKSIRKIHRLGKRHIEIRSKAMYANHHTAPGISNSIKSNDWHRSLPGPHHLAIWIVHPWRPGCHIQIKPMNS